jgi:hypothetical protein
MTNFLHYLPWVLSSVLRFFMRQNLTLFFTFYAFIFFYSLLRFCTSLFYLISSLSLSTSPTPHSLTLSHSLSLLPLLFIHDFCIRYDREHEFSENAFLVSFGICGKMNIFIINGETPTEYKTNRYDNTCTT